MTDTGQHSFAVLCTLGRFIPLDHMVERLTQVRGKQGQTLSKYLRQQKKPDKGA